ncbi:helix-turn-helix domain-containing protein [Marinobacter sp. M1N3S26]|uniref:helix-turn-helix domain-containing protein n=1 Tax=Marinobacter sp. M1N3S26 TaxID=3382299 RepID=UPI00387A8C75
MAFIESNIRQRIHSGNTSALLPRKYTPAYDYRMETIYSEWLRKLMDKRGISQYKLASLSGVPQPTIQRILSGESKNPKADTLSKLSRALGSDDFDDRYDLSRGETSVPPELNSLLSEASPRSYKQLMKIAEAAANGRLTEDDVNLLNAIAERIANKE